VLAASGWYAVLRLVAGGLLGGSLLGWAFRDLRLDDAYIAFQFARNLASGEGLVFNPGERIFGFTSPLHVLTLAVVYAAAGDVLAQAAVLLGGVALTAQAWLVYRLLRPSSRYLAGLTGLLVWLGWAGSHLSLALETNLFAALVLATLWVLERRRPGWAGAALGLAFLGRYDAGLLVPIVAVRAWWRDRTPPRSLLGVAFLVVAPWLLWTQVYFGTILPNTALAKAGVSGAAEYLGYYGALFARSPWGLLGEHPVSTWLARLTPLAWLSGLVYAWRHAPRLVPLVIFAAGELVAYALIGPPLGHHWHMQVPRLVAVVLLLAGTVGWLERGLSARGAPRRVALTALAGLLVAPSALAAWSASRSVGAALWLGDRHARYVTAAGWMVEHLRPGQSLLAPEIGTLGYLTRYRMIDPYGLINPTNDFPRTRRLVDLVELIAVYRPDVLFLDVVPGVEAIERGTTYRIVARFRFPAAAYVLFVADPERLRRPDQFAALREASGIGSP
jgi:arabinofuranosyltransferase